MAMDVQEMKPVTDGANQNEDLAKRQYTDDNKEPLIINQENKVQSEIPGDRKPETSDNAKIVSITNAVLKRQTTDSKHEISLGQKQTVVRPSSIVFIATFGALLGALSMGLALGYTAPAFVDMERATSNNTILDHDPNRGESQKSLIGSTLAIGALVAAMASDPCNNLCGRRIPLILCGVPFTIGWLLITFADKLIYLVLGRLILGASCGIACGTAPTYVSEIAPPRIRGSLGTCFQLMVVIGNLMASIFGIFLSWRMLAGLSLIPGLGMTAMMLFLPESPTWLVGKHRREEAEQALRRLRSSPIESELNEMIQARMIQQQESSASVYSCDILRSNEFLKPLGFALGLMFFQQFTGINAVLMYQSDIFKKASPNSDALLSTVWVCLAQVVATIVCGMFIDRLGRRLLLWISGAGCMLTLVILGTYSYIANVNKDFQQNFAAVPLFSLILFITFFSFGFGPIPWMMIPELASSRVRSLIASFGTLFAWTGAYVVTASIKPIMLAVGDAWAYWILSIICGISMLFTIILPETKVKIESDISNK